MKPEWYGGYCEKGCPSRNCVYEKYPCMLRGLELWRELQQAKEQIGNRTVKIVGENGKECNIRIEDFANMVIGQCNLARHERDALRTKVQNIIPDLDPCDNCDYHHPDYGHQCVKDEVRNHRDYDTNKDPDGKECKRYQAWLQLRKIGGAE